MGAVAPRPGALIAPIGLQPLSDLTQARLAQDVREVRAGGAVLGPGEAWLKSPGHSPESAFTLFQFWDEISGQASFKTTEAGIKIVGEVAADLLPIAHHVNRRFQRLPEAYRGTDFTSLQIRDAFLNELRDEVAKSAAALQIPMIRSRVSKAAGDASEAISRVLPPHGQDRLLTPVGLRRELKAVKAASAPFVRMTSEMAVTLKRVTDAVDKVDRYVAILPFAAAAMDLLAAKSEAEAALALKCADEAFQEWALSTATAGTIGALATLAITISPAAWGFYGIVAIRIGAGVAGFYAEPVVQQFHKERMKLLETKASD